MSSMVAGWVGTCYSTKPEFTKKGLRYEALSCFRYLIVIFPFGVAYSSPIMPFREFTYEIRPSASTTPVSITLEAFVNT